MVASIRSKKKEGGELYPTSFPLSHPHKIFPPQPLLHLYILFKSSKKQFIVPSNAKLEHLE
jgi:hypothetical protein